MLFGLIPIDAIFLQEFPVMGRHFGKRTGFSPRREGRQRVLAAPFEPEVFPHAALAGVAPEDENPRVAPGDVVLLWC